MSDEADPETAYLQKLQEQAADLAKAFDEANPTGTDTAYDEDFGTIKTQIDKLTNLSAGTPDWNVVIEGATRLLRERTKDLRLLVWLAIARMHRDQCSGIAEGLAAVKQVAEAHWDKIHPARPRARANVASWLGEQMGLFFEHFAAKPSDRLALTTLEGQLKELDAFFEQKLGEAYAGMSVLTRMIRDKARELPEPAAAPARTTATPEPRPAAAREATAPSAAPPQPGASAVAAPTVGQIAGNEEDVLRVLRTLRSSILEAARVLRQADPAKPWAYHLHRVGIWLTIREPPIAEGGKTRLPRPRENDAKGLQQLLAGGRHIELLEAAESACAESMFWLDPHRYAAAAMDQLGALFLQARAVLVQGLLGFLNRFPDLYRWTFSDGTPLADSATQAFIEEELRKMGVGGGASSASANEEDEDLKRRFQDAQELVHAGKVAEGLALATQLASRGADGRTRFRARLNVAQMALKGGQPSVARPLLTALSREAETNHLEVWEPALCVTLYSALLDSLKHGDKEEQQAHAAQRRHLFDKLCELDPSAAIRVSGL